MMFARFKKKAAECRFLNLSTVLLTCKKHGKDAANSLVADATKW